MHPTLNTLQLAVEIVAGAGIVSSLLYYFLCLWSASVFLRERDRPRNARPAQNLPPVSILKPLKGIDPEIYQSFRSHCLQDYPEYEIIFGVSDPNDPAIASVKALQQEFPQHKIQFLVCPQILGANVKVSNLVQMLPVARYEHLIVNDSDIRVEADYLQRVVAPLSDPQLGLVTCLYRGVAAQTLGSRLESLGISTDFSAGVLAARQLEGGIRFGLGSTLAFRRSDLERIGGFRPIVDHLADDYELGARLAALGLTVELSDVVVETLLPPYRVADFIAHQLRWARGVRDARAAGYFGLIFTFGILWALLASSGEPRRTVVVRFASLCSFATPECGPDRRPQNSQGSKRSQRSLADSAARPDRRGSLAHQSRRSHRDLARRTFPLERRQADALNPLAYLEWLCPLNFPRIGQGSTGLSRQAV